MDPAANARPPQWCENQIACSDWPNGWACGAHILDRYVFQCPYAPGEIADFGGGRHKPAKDASRYKGVCEDYEPVKPSA